MRMRKKKNLVPRMERCDTVHVKEGFEMRGKWREELPEMYPDMIKENGFEAVDYQHIFYYAHPEWIKTFKKRGIHLNAWTVNKEEDMDWFIERKFDYITTDYPGLLLKNLGYQNK